MTTPSGARPPLTLAAAHTEGFELVKRHARRFLDYVGALDAGALVTPVPGSAWTVGETVTHVRSVVLRYTRDLRRSQTLDGVAAQNADDVARLGVDVPAAARDVTEQLAVLDQFVAHIAPEQRFPFHVGQHTTLAGAWGNLLGELLAHGDDIARATGAPFGVPSADLEILWRFTAPLLQGWLRPEAASESDTWLLRFPFGPIGVVFDAGQLRWGEPPPAAPDQVVDVHDAAELALVFPYRRRPPADPAVATLAGRFYPL